MDLAGRRAKRTSKCSKVRLSRLNVACLSNSGHTEDEEIDDGEETSVEDDEPINPLVNALFDEVEELRLQLYDAHLRCALIEAEVREEVMVEMEERMRSMEDMFTRRLMRVVSSIFVLSPTRSPIMA